uniref:C2H2-type domain-containing protein n=1 Tax=viral metagenome TaxID=1070528 RepID=A0A6C0E1N3_9ZZZZ
MKPNETEKVQKSSGKFHCGKCDYTTCRQSQYDRHLHTFKHLNATRESQNEPISSEKVQAQYGCYCGITFNSRTTLWRHKKQCTHNKPMVNSSTPINNTDNKDELINYLIKENQEFKQLILEICKNNSTNITNTNTNSNNNNKTFNLNLFLNETCKDAMNIMDFVESVKLDLTDLETVGNTGFVNGISNIIIKNLKGLDVTKRPLHCTDSKREVLYVKDENKWEKENEEKEKLRKVINHISTKNIQQIPLWVHENPNCKDSESNKNTEYLHIVGQCMGCTEDKNFQKIIHNISKEVMVDK